MEQKVGWQSYAEARFTSPYGMKVCRWYAHRHPTGKGVSGSIRYRIWCSAGMRIARMSGANTFKRGTQAALPPRRFKSKGRLTFRVP